MKQKSPFGIALLAACDEKKAHENMKRKYSLRALARDADIDQSHLTRCTNGDANISRDLLAKICNALGCSNETRTVLYYEAGFVVPAEVRNATHAA